jgi:signal transduction histidine kinase
MRTILRWSSFDGVIANLRSFPHFTFSRKRLAIVCLLLVGAVGYIDYSTGYERSLLLFYLLPISLAAWFGSLVFGFAIVIIGLTAWVVANRAAGIPDIGFWSVGTVCVSYALFGGVLWKLGTLMRELDRRVQERTEALRREVAERQRLDREIAQVADRERRRLGQGLHDTLGQHLTGTALAAQVLKEKLAVRAAPEAPEAEKVVDYIEQGIELTRNLARGFFSLELEGEGLIVGLQGLAEDIKERFRIDCVFDGQDSVQVHDSATATQLYRIAQEAATNSAKHAAAGRIAIRLAMDGSELTLSIIDDGIGFPDKLPSPQGLGLRLMRHGAALIGGSFDIRRNGGRGTIATCKLSIPSDSDLDGSP